MIEQLKEPMADLPFVEWDRYVTGQWDADHDYVKAYGWIDRDDGYKDFVILTTWSDTNQINFTTSSSEHTERIHELLFDESPENHHGCQRIEDAVDIPNMVSINAE